MKRTISLPILGLALLTLPASLASADEAAPAAEEAAKATTKLTIVDAEGGG